MVVFYQAFAGISLNFVIAGSILSSLQICAIDAKNENFN